jgi:AcrR family transcriptional regulator
MDDSAATIAEAPDTAGTSSGPCPQRRRGAALEDAIFEAAFAELTAVGYAALTIEAVAARARTGKASIYRRWPTKQDLVMDTLLATLPEARDCVGQFDFPDSVTTVEALHAIARRITQIINSPAGDAVRAIKCEAASDPELARLVDERFQEPRRQAMIALLERGIARGEVRPGAATPLVADVLPAILMHRVIIQQQPITEGMVTEIVDQVLVPLIEVR